MAKPRERLTKKMLDWEELESAPNTRGAFSFLKSAAEIVSIRRSEIQETPEETPPVDKMTTVVTPTTVPSKPIRKGLGTRPYKVHRCTLVQHGQSLGETTLYQALWANGRPETTETRVITAGWRSMKKLCGMTDKNCKRNTALLIEKLAIEQIGEENGHTRTGRTYRIYSFSNTLARRKAAGMEWAIWDRGRRFVQKDGSPLVAREPIADKTTTVVAQTTVVKATPVTVVNTTPVTVVNTTPVTVVKTTPVLIGTLLEIENKESSSSVIRDITDALTAQVSLADEEAARQLIRACRAFCPDASTKEILELIREKGDLMRSMGSVKNPIGFLLKSVAAVFDGEGIRSYRRQQLAADEMAKQRELEEARKQQEEDKWLLAERDRLLRRIADPATPSQQKDAARRNLQDVQAMLSGH
jgi:hypothetical protein